MPIDNNVRLCYNGRRNNEKNKDERFRHVFQQQRNRESRGWSERPSIPSNGSVTKLAVPRSAWIIRRQRGGWAKYIDDETNERRFLIKRTCSTFLAKPKKTLCESHNVPKNNKRQLGCRPPLWGYHPSPPLQLRL